MDRSLTLLDSGLVEFRTLDRLLQAVVFFADSVAIRATYEVAPKDRQREADIEWRIEALREQGLVKLWAHEYEVDEAGYAHDPSDARGVRRPADLVVVEADLARSLGEMDEVMRSIRETAYRDVPGGQRPYRQGTAEIVGLRNSLASLVISSELNQDGLLTNPATRTSLVNGLRPAVGERFQSAVVREVIGQLELGSLTQLSPEQVEECRRYAADFRKLLDDCLLATARGMDPVLTPKAIATELASRYRAITAEYAPPRIGREMGAEVIWDLLGATLPSSIALKYGLKALKWRKQAAVIRPYLLLMHLERSLRRGG